MVIENLVVNSEKGSLWLSDYCFNSLHLSVDQLNNLCSDFKKQNQILTTDIEKWTEDLE